MHFNVAPRLRGSLVWVLCAFLLLLASFPLKAAQETPNWWTVPAEREDIEKGRLQDLAGRKKVWVNVTFADTRPNSPLTSTERTDITEAVRDAIFAQKELTVVTFPEEADFALLVRASTAQGGGPNFSLLVDSEALVSIDVTVVVPGAQLSDGTRMPRVVWEASSPNAQVEAAAASRFVVDGFLWEWKKVRERRK
jgi:hypothetical protein